MYLIKTRKEALELEELFSIIAKKQYEVIECSPMMSLKERRAYLELLALLKGRTIEVKNLAPIKLCFKENLSELLVVKEKVFKVLSLIWVALWEWRKPFSEDCPWNKEILITLRNDMLAEKAFYREHEANYNGEVLPFSNHDMESIISKDELE